jgi:hypothetical protein
MIIKEKITNWLNSRGINFGQSKIDFFVFLSLFLIGLYLFFPKEIPFYGGEFHSVFAIKGILESGLPEMPSGVIYIRNFFSHYFQALFALLLGFSEIALRLPIFFLFIIFFFLYFDYVCKTYGKRAGLMAIALLVFSGWFLRYNQYIRFYSFAIYLLFFAFYFFDKYFFKKGHRSDLILFVVTSTVGIFNSRIGWAVFILALIPSIKAIWNKGFKKYKSILLSFLFLLIIFLVNLKIPGRISGFGDISASTYKSAAGLFDSFIGLVDFGNYFGGVYSQYLVSWYGWLVGFALLSIPLILISKKRRLEKITPILFAVIIILLLNLTQLNRDPSRIISAIIPYFYLSIAISVYFGYKLLSTKLPDFKNGFFILSIILVISIGTNQYFWDYVAFSRGENISLNGPLSTGFVSHRITSNQQSAQYILNNYQKGDKVISAKVFGWDNLYLGDKLDKTIITKSVETAAPLLIIKNKNLTGYRLVYHDVGIIDSFDQLVKYIGNNRRVWLLVDDQADIYNNKIFFDFLKRSSSRKIDLDNDLPLYLFN